MSEPKLIRICGVCSKQLTKENTSNLQWLQPNCNYCTEHPITYEKYNHLLEFVKKLAELNKSDSDVSALYDAGYRMENCSSARLLLKEIGEL